MIVTQCCGLCLILVILFLLLKNNRLRIYSENIFFMLMYNTFIVVVFDIALCMSIMKPDIQASIPSFALAKGYWISYVVLTFLSCTYTLSGFKEFKYKIKQQSIQVVVLVVICGIIGVLPIKYFYDGEHQYTYGLAVTFSYIVICFYSLVHMYLLIRYRDAIDRARKVTMWTWIILTISSLIVQECMPGILLLSFMTVLSLVVIFFELENPCSRLDRKTDLFLFNILSEYLYYQNEDDKDYIVVVLGIIDKKDGYLDTDLKFLSRVVSKYLSSVNRVYKIFKHLDNEYILVMNGLDEFDAFKDDLDKYCTEYGVDDNLRPTYVIAYKNVQLFDVEKFIDNIIEYANRVFKKKDRNTVTFADYNTYQSIIEVENTKEMIMNAIIDNRVEVFLQPIYSVKDNRFTSAEVLARIRDTNGQIVPPIKFIPVAEETGLITKIENIIFEQAIKFIKEENLRTLGINYLEINLSVKRGEGDDLADYYNNIIKKYGISANMINLEITETASISSRNKLMENMGKLMDKGIRFSLDDFGSGESNLNYIIDMPVDIVKFDKDMTQSYFTNDKANIVMPRMVDMIHDLGLKVVAEGVETKEQLQEIIDLGVDYIQGYYFSKPLARHDFKEFLINKVVG